MLEDINKVLRDDGFVLTREQNINDIECFKNFGFNICFSRKINDYQQILLLNKVSIRNHIIFKDDILLQMILLLKDIEK